MGDILLNANMKACSNFKCPSLTKPPVNRALSLLTFVCNAGTNEVLDFKDKFRHYLRKPCGLCPPASWFYFSLICHLQIADCRLCQQSIISLSKPMATTFFTNARSAAQTKNLIQQKTISRSFVFIKALEILCQDFNWILFNSIFLSMAQRFCLVGCQSLPIADGLGFFVHKCGLCWRIEGHPRERKLIDRIELNRLDRVPSHLWDFCSLTIYGSELQTEVHRYRTCRQKE